MKSRLLHRYPTLPGWLGHTVQAAASAIEAQRAETENTGSVEDESAAPQEDAQTSAPSSEQPQ